MRWYGYLHVTLRKLTPGHPMGIRTIEIEKCDSMLHWDHYAFMFPATWERRQLMSQQPLVTSESARENTVDFPSPAFTDLLNTQAPFRVLSKLEMIEAELGKCYVSGAFLLGLRRGKDVGDSTESSKHRRWFKANWSISDIASLNTRYNLFQTTRRSAAFW